MADPSPPTVKPMRKQVEEYIVSLQNEIVSAFEALDPSAPPFKRDSWLRPQGGSGQSCVFATLPSSLPSENSPLHQSILEKAGVNISIVHGTLPPPAIKQMRADHATLPLPEDVKGGLPFFAAGISLVVHPRNPNAPTVHANYRYFEITEPPAPADTSSTTTGTGDKTTPDPNAPPKVLAWWFGGGSDLTPSYFFEEDAIHFHRTLKSACDQHGAALFPAFKKWCDEYFYIPHRGESRGIGGIFFDDLTEGPHIRLSPPEEAPTPAVTQRPTNAAEIFSLVCNLGSAFIPSYLPILTSRHSLPYTPLQRRWQLIRRGRYVEFNLVYDRGTKFGLMTPGARVESILMSLPEEARWEYQCELGTDADTEEGKLVEVLKTPREWV